MEQKYREFQAKRMKIFGELVKDTGTTNLQHLPISKSLLWM